MTENLTSEEEYRIDLSAYNVRALILNNDRRSKARTTILNTLDEIRTFLEGKNRETLGCYDYLADTITYGEIFLRGGDPCYKEWDVKFRSTRRRFYAV